MKLYMKNKGITMISLVLTVIILLILAGISIGAGSNIITKSKLENIKTDMMLIKVKGKEYVENANYSLGTGFDKITDENEKNTRIENAKSKLKGTEIEEDNGLDSIIGINSDKFQEEKQNLTYYYKLSTKDLEDIGISNVKSDEKNGEYIIKYDIKNVEIEIYNTQGFKNENKNYYSLNELENLEV